jgi:hypothetical protein
MHNARRKQPAESRSADELHGASDNISDDKSRTNVNAFTCCYEEENKVALLKWDFFSSKVSGLLQLLSRIK